MIMDMFVRVLVISILFVPVCSICQPNQTEKALHHFCVARSFSEQIKALQRRMEAIEDVDIAQCQTEVAGLKTTVTRLEQELSHIRAVMNISARPCLLDDVPSAGRNEANHFNDSNVFQRSGYAKISSFRVCYRNLVHCFGLSYGGTQGDCHGFNDGVCTLVEEELDSDEYITKIGGIISSRHGYIIGLKVTTNKRTYGRYGRNRGRSFELSGRGKHLAYISGRYGELVDKLQLHFHC